MHLYDCRFGTFIEEATSGQIADILRRRFVRRLDQNASESEVRSWRNSLGAFAESLHGVGMDDAWIVLEYQLPLSSARVDATLLGTDQSQTENAVLLEFKQWDRCLPSYVPDLVKVGGIDHLHPSAQVLSYQRYLTDTHEAFVDGHIAASSCAYLHNVASPQDSFFFEPSYADLLETAPAFCLETVEELARFAGERTRFGASQQLVGNVLHGRYRPSKALLNYVADAIEGYEPWQLLDEQLVVYNRILAEIEQAQQSAEKRVIIATGGPGTGKSVIAVQVLGAAARKHYTVAHATGSKAFTTNLRGIVRTKAPFLYTHNFRDTPRGDIDLIVCDEAHRLRARTQFGPMIYSDRPQAEEIIDAAKVSVFLLDQHQSVRKNEMGSVSVIKGYADSLGIPVSLYDLDTQFRCAGSESYIRWIEYVLGLSDEASYAWKRNDEYEVKVFDQVKEMETALRKRRDEGNTARMVAGFCWDWSDPRPSGELVHDVVVGSWSKPWNRKPRDMWKNRGAAPKPEVHPYTIWATESAGFEEVGCIYSAQGFEFDYVGVIWGPDLQWDPRTGSWSANLGASKDRGGKRGLTKNPALAVEKLSHIYRVLSTRGMKGTYFYHLDEATRRRFQVLLTES